MVWLVLAPIVLGIAIYKLPSLAARSLAIAGQAGFAWLALTHWLRVDDQPIFEVLGGDNAVLYITLRGDHTSLALVTMTGLLFTVSLIYVMRGAYTDNKLLLMLLVLQGLSTGIFIADDVFTLFVLFEVASLVTVLLVMFRKNRRNTYDGLYYLVIQLVAMMFFLFGAAYLYRTFGVLSVTQISEAINLGLVDGRTLALPFAFTITGIGLKAGLFPLFTYVPRSYGNPGAPSPMLLIMSCVLVKGALFWVYRLAETFTPAMDVTRFLTVVGVLTGIAGAVIALAQSDLRLLLAYSTVSQAGLILLGFAADSPTATSGALLHLVTHALAKAILFLTAAAIIRRYGTVELSAIRGVGRRMPLIAGLAAFAMLSMVGAPFTSGALSKDLMLTGASGVVEIAMWVVNFLTTLVMLRLAATMFGQPHDPSAATAIGRQFPDRIANIVTLAAVSICIAVFANQATDLIIGGNLQVVFVPSWSKTLTFAVMTAGACLVYLLAVRIRATTNALDRMQAPLTIDISLPQATLLLTGFFAATLLWATLATRGVGL